MLIPQKTAGLRQRDCRLQNITEVQDLLRYREQWERLAALCVEPNVFYEPWMLLPAIKHLISDAQRNQLRFILVWHTEGNSEELIGFFPFSDCHSYHGIPLRHLRSLHHCHCYLTTPLLKAGCEAICWRILFNWINTSSRYRFCRLCYIGGESDAYNECIKAAKQLNCHLAETDSHVRPSMTPLQSFPEYLRLHVARKTAKDIRRKFRRLEELGVSKTVDLHADDCVDTWVQDFMDLESRGWKGESGVALVHDADHMRFFRDICAEGGKRNVLHMSKLTLDNSPIAMKCSFQSGRTLFACKIAYDERYAQCSPGMLLEYEQIQKLSNQSAIRSVDSCMQPGNTRMSKLWGESRIIRFVNISAAGVFSRAVVSLVPILKKVRDTLHDKCC